MAASDPVLPNLTNETDGLNGTNSTIVIPLPHFVACYGIVLFLATATICVGTWLSVKKLDSDKKDQKEGKKIDIDVMTSESAAKFPIVASVALFGLFVLLKVLPKNWLSNIFNIHFMFMGLLCITRYLSMLFGRFVPSLFPDHSFVLSLSDKDNKSKDKPEVQTFEFTSIDLLFMVPSAGVILGYVLRQNWICLDIIALTFSVTGIEMVCINKIINGVIMLCGLFVYDIFWVFGTPVMTTVAKNFDAPVKIVFPQDLFLNGFFEASKMGMLGLGDIVLPGIFIAFMVRFEVFGLKRSGWRYAYIGVLGYVLGLLICVTIMHKFSSSQPALLYLVPTCFIFSFGPALLGGHLKELMSYEDHSESAIKANEALGKSEDVSVSEDDGSKNYKAPSSPASNTRSRKVPKDS